jgi:serine/threonine protein phosphatase PrpC
MGAHLSEPITLKDSEHGENENLRFGATSMQGWRKEQEDAHIVELDLPDGCSVFGVFDGHGGKIVSIYVKRVFVNELKRLQTFKQKQYEAALKEVMYRMDEMMLSTSGQEALKKIALEVSTDITQAGDDNNVALRVGCTAVVVLVTPTHIYCANSGDSRSVLARSADNESVTAVALSEDHKPDNELEQKRIEAAGGSVSESRVNGNLALSRALGDFEYKLNKSKSYKEQMVTCLPDITKNER